MPKKHDTIHAAQQFEQLGIELKDHTRAMQLAVSQRWTNLPVDLPVGELRKRIAAVKTAPVASVEDVMADRVTAGENPVVRADCEAEVARLKRNAAVNAWRERNQLQAALDAREIAWRARFAKKSTKKAAAPAGAVA